MLVTQHDAAELLEACKIRLQTFLGEQNEFLSALSEEDDWSFIVKGHALVEAAVTKMLTSALGDERIYPIIERLPLSDATIGKIAVGKELGLLDAGQRKFIRWFSTLRNDLVHKVENLKFSFADHISSFDKNQRRAWTDSIAWSETAANRPESLTRLTLEHPKGALRISIFQIVALCELATCQSIAAKDLAEKSGSTTSAHVLEQKRLIDLQQNLIEQQIDLLSRAFREDSEVQMDD